VNLLNRLNYLSRIGAAYCLPGRSQLSFWHETPALHPDIDSTTLGPYYMTFASKADYLGPFDAEGVPQLNYRGKLGLQYNPIAIAQYALGNYNRYLENKDAARRGKFLHIADWLVNHLEKNLAGLSVWNHHFNWEYRSPLVAPWYSGLAQGQGISVLVRAHKDTGESRYLDAARLAFQTFLHPIEKGGVVLPDGKGRAWIEEYLVSPPTHILNGFFWAVWGVHDFYLTTGDPAAKKVWNESVSTLVDALPTYDTGYWSLYEHSGTWLQMVASPFYHALHIVQLRVMHQLTGAAVFAETADRWDGYRRSIFRRSRAWVQKAIFKLLYY